MINKTKLAEIIGKRYGLSVKNISEGPRQFVAETYKIETSGDNYFCKVIAKPLFIPHVIESLPVLRDICQSGFERANHPIPTSKGELYIHEYDNLIVLFNYIDAPQSYKYDNYEFGRLIGQLHLLSNKISHRPKKEQFVFKYHESFWKKLENLTNPEPNDQIAIQLGILVGKYMDELKHDYDNFVQLGSNLRAGTYEMVVTHGDPGGNILAKSPTDLFLIDWDDILLSPAERDVWFFQNEAEFMKGYRQFFPRYEVNLSLSHYFTYKRYFEDLMEYFVEITGDQSDEHRMKNLNALENDCFEGWLRPAIRQFNPI